MRPASLPLAACFLVACAGAPPPAPPPPPPLAPTASAQAGAPFAPAPPVLRLPPLARPLRVDLDLALDPRAPMFSGRVGIDLEVLAPTRVLWLNATDLVLDAVTLEASGARLTARVIPGGEDFVGLVFDHELAPGKARVTATYHGAVDQERSRGIYAVREGDGEPYLYTFFEPIDARRAFPCFDEPAAKVPWRLSFHVPKGDVALANAPVESERPEGDGKVVQMAESKPLPSYLVAFVVGPFDVIDAGAAGHSGTPLRFVVPRGRGAETAYAASITPRIVGALEDYFGMPYPYGKLDVAVVPRYWGTMEHPGLVAMGQPLTLIAPGEQSVEREQAYEDIAAHELAHYWFGDYVTTAWWDDTWLNEALGTWMDERVTQTLVPGWSFEVERVERAGIGLRKDALASAKKIRQPVESRADIESSFDAAITYSKGQAVLGMFEAWMTPERFQRAVRAYMTAHAWKSATADDFFGALDAEQPGAGAAIRTFVDQPGVPSVQVQASCEGSSRAIVVKQRRYQALGTTVGPETWSIPVCVRYASGKGAGRACMLLTGEQATIPIDTPSCPAWVIGNADGLGYYHVVYSPSALRAAFSPAAGMTAAERVAAVGDAAALVASGELLLGDALELVAATAASPERHVVRAGASLLRLARESAMTDAQATKRAAMIRAIYGRKATQLGFARLPGDGIDASLLRPDVLSLVAMPGGDPGLRRRAHDLALSWLGDPPAVAPEVVDVVLGAGAKTNDARLFDALLRKAKAEPDHRRKEQLVGALGAFTDAALAKRARTLVTDGTFDVRDALGILWAQFGDRATRGAAWAFLKESFDAVTAHMRSDDVDQLLRLAETFCDEDRQREVQEFFAPRVTRFDGGPRALANAVESIGQCAATFKRSRGSVEAVLGKY